MSTTAFSSLPLDPEFIANIESLDYRVMTPIQAQALPEVLAGKDLLAQAKTGSGKTAAFAIGLLHKLESKTYQTQALVLCPTRELADQVDVDVLQFGDARGRLGGVLDVVVVLPHPVPERACLAGRREDEGIGAESAKMAASYATCPSYSPAARRGCTKDGSSCWARCSSARHSSAAR